MRPASSMSRKGVAAVSSRTLIVAAIAGLLLGCGSSQRIAPQPGPISLADTGYVCAARVDGAKFEAEDIPWGASLKYTTNDSDKAVAMRSFAHERPLEGSARASGGAPMHQSAQLPPVMIEVYDRTAGALIIYTAVNRADIERVRELVRWDADVQNKGYCSRLRPPAGGYENAPSGP